MSDADLERKFHGLVDPVLGKERASAVIERYAEISGCANVGALTALTRPSG